MLASQAPVCSVLIYNPTRRQEVGSIRHSGILMLVWCVRSGGSSPTSSSTSTWSTSSSTPSCSSWWGCRWRCPSPDTGEPSSEQRKVFCYRDKNNSYMVEKYLQSSDRVPGGGGVWRGGRVAALPHLLPGGRLGRGVRPHRRPRVHTRHELEGENIQPWQRKNIYSIFRRTEPCMMAETRTRRRCPGRWIL